MRISSQQNIPSHFQESAAEVYTQYKNDYQNPRNEQVQARGEEIVHYSHAPRRPHDAEGDGKDPAHTFLHIAGVNSHAPKGAPQVYDRLGQDAAAQYEDGEIADRGCVHSSSAEDVRQDGGGGDVVEEDAAAIDLGHVVQVEPGRPYQQVRVDVGVTVRERPSVVQVGVTQDDSSVGRLGVEQPAPATSHAE